MRLAATLALALCVALAAPIAAKAAGDQPPGAAGAERMQRWAADHQAMIDARLDDMKDALKLTANQYPLWEMFETAVRNADKARMDDMRQMLENRERMSPVDRLDVVAGHMARRAADVKKIADAAKPFYDSLDDTQKRNFGVRWEDLGGTPGAPGCQRTGIRCNSGHCAEPVIVTSAGLSVPRKEQGMITLSRRTVVALAASLGVLFAGATQTSAMSDKDLVQALRAGGLVIVVRHGATFPDQADTDPLNFDNVAAQRNLNDKGKELARRFGEALRRAGVPVGQVYTSKYNRAYETAVLAGFKGIEKTADLTEGGLIVSPNENNRRAEAFRKMLAAAPQPGTNTVLITHYPNIIAALGRDWFDVKEGEASIFRPQDGAYVLVARVQMDEWLRIADTVK